MKTTKQILLIAAFIVSAMQLQAQWNLKLNTGSSIDIIDFVDNQTGYCSDGDFLYRTQNGGDAWSIIADFSLYTTHVYDINWVDANTAFAACNDGLILKTVNAGFSWTKSNPFSIKTYYNQIYFYDSNTGFVSGYAGTLKTTNAGLSWDTISQMAFSDIYFSDPNNGYAIRGQKLYRTSDGGDSWYAVLSKGTDLQFVDANTAYMADENEIYSSTDGGQSWSLIYTAPYINYSSISSYFYLDFINNLEGYIWNVYGEMYKTKDGGNTWDNVSLGYDTLGCVYFINADTGFLSAYGNLSQLNQGVYKTTSGAVLVSGIMDVLIGNKYTVSISPNPASDFITVAINENEIIQNVKIYSVCVKMILEKRNIINHEAELDISNLPKGVYFVVVETKAQSSAKRINKF